MAIDALLASQLAAMFAQQGSRFARPGSAEAAFAASQLDTARGNIQAEAIKKDRRRQKKKAKKSQLGGIGASLGSLAGIAGAALAPFTGGASLALTAGAGAAGGALGGLAGSGGETDAALRGLVTGGIGGIGAGLGGAAASAAGAGGKVANVAKAGGAALGGAADAGIGISEKLAMQLASADPVAAATKFDPLVAKAAAAGGQAPTIPQAAGQAAAQAAPTLPATAAEVTPDTFASRLGGAVKGQFQDFVGGEGGQENVFNLARQLAAGPPESTLPDISARDTAFLGQEGVSNVTRTLQQDRIHTSRMQAVEKDRAQNLKLQKQKIANDKAEFEIQTQQETAKLEQGASKEAARSAEDIRDFTAKQTKEEREFVFKSEASDTAAALAKRKQDFEEAKPPAIRAAQRFTAQDGTEMEIVQNEQGVNVAQPLAGAPEPQPEPATAAAVSTAMRTASDASRRAVYAQAVQNLEAQGKTPDQVLLEVGTMEDALKGGVSAEKAFFQLTPEQQAHFAKQMDADAALALSGQIPPVGIPGQGPPTTLTPTQSELDDSLTAAE